MDSKHEKHCINVADLSYTAYQYIYSVLILCFSCNIEAVDMGLCLINLTLIFLYILFFRSFWAVDMKGSASHTLTVVIVKCSGCSGHGDCDFDHPTPTSQSNQLSVPCICHNGWEGMLML